MTKPNKKNSAQSALGAKARKLEGLLATHGLQLPHMKAMDLLSALEGHRTRHGDESARTKAKPLAGPVTDEAFDAARLAYEADRPSVDRVHPTLGVTLSKLFGMPTRHAGTTAVDAATLGEQVTTEVHSDDYVMEASFDARHFLAAAPALSIAGLISCGWRGDYPADRVAEFQAERLGNAEVGAVLSYATKKRDMGYECSIDEAEALAWLRSQRRTTLLHALSIAYGLGETLDDAEPELAGEVRAFIAARDTANLDPAVTGVVVGSDVKGSATFDARNYLSQASSDDVADLIVHGWSSSAPSDAVATYEASRNPDGEVRAFIDTVRSVAQGDFSCSVDRRAAMEWLRAYRTDVLAGAHAKIAADVGEKDAVRMRQRASAGERPQLLPFVADDTVTTILNRFGEVCDSAMSARIGDAEMTNYLDSLVDECCMVVERKDRIGILLEIEYMSLAGDDHADATRRTWPDGFEPTEENVSMLLRRAFGFLAKEHPYAEAYVTGSDSDVCMARCALRIFVPGDHVEPGIMERLSETVSTVVDVHGEARKLAQGMHISEHVGFAVLPAANGFAWTHLDSDDVDGNSSDTIFPTEEEAWRDADMTVASNVMGNRNLSDEEWDAMDFDEQVELAHEDY